MSSYTLYQVLLDLYLLATSMPESGNWEKYNEFNPDKKSYFHQLFFSGIYEAIP